MLQYCYKFENVTSVQSNNRMHCYGVVSSISQLLRNQQMSKLMACNNYINVSSQLTGYLVIYISTAVQ